MSRVPAIASPIPIPNNCRYRSRRSCCRSCRSCRSCRCCRLCCCSSCCNDFVMWHIPWHAYCTISVNSAWHVTRYMPAENLISAPRRNGRYHPFFSALLANFFAILEFFGTFFFYLCLYEFGTWPDQPLQLLHFGNFGGTVTCYCRIDRNSTVI